MPISRPNAARAAALAAGSVAVFLLLLARGASPVRAQDAGEHIRSFSASYEVEPDGTVRVTEEIVIDFGENERHGIFRDLRISAACEPQTGGTGSARCPAGYERHWPVSNVSVTDGEGVPLPATKLSEGNVLRLRIGDPDQVVTGVQQYRISYVIEGALDRYESHDELYWNVTGTWPYPIERATASVRVAGRAPELLACFAGPSGSTERCLARATEDAAVFEAGPLQAGEELTIVAGWPTGWVEVPPPLLSEVKTLEDYVATGPLDIAAAGAGSFAAILALFGLWRRFGRDRRYRSVRYLTGETAEEAVPLFGDHPIVVEYTPPDDLPPGLMGVLMDERVDPRDIAATIVDLAVRGHLRITEIEKRWLFGSRDWQLELLPGGDELRPWEAELLDGLFRRGTVRLSELRKSWSLRRSIARAQKELYREAVRRGWFSRPPNQQKTLWLLGGAALEAAGLGLGALLGYATGHALLAAPVVVLGLGTMALSPTMARRTAAGREMLRRIAGFRRFIEVAEKERQRFFEEANTFEKYLPYAIAFDCVEKWARAFEGLGRAPGTAPVGSWYVATGTPDFGRLASSFESFATAAAATTGGGSGFSGGSAGGGGGGGSAAGRGEPPRRRPAVRSAERPQPGPQRMRVVRHDAVHAGAQRPLPLVLVIERPGEHGELPGTEPGNERGFEPGVVDGDGLGARLQRAASERSDRLPAHGRGDKRRRNLRRRPSRVLHDGR